MSRALRWGGLFGLLLLLLAWTFNDSIPENYSAPWALRAHLASTKVMISCLLLMSDLGITNYEKSIQGLVDTYVDRNLTIPEHITVTDDVFDDVKVRIYRPTKMSSEEEGFRGLVYYHGGGWFMGNIPMYDPLMLDIVSQVDVVVVSVDYRLAPQHKYPAGLNDCVIATKYFINNSDKFGVDGQRISVGGDSAGGNLAAAVTLKLRDEGYPWMPRNQLLIYPTLQCMDFSLPSFVQNYYGPIGRTYLMARACSVYATGSEEHTTSFLKGYHTTSEVKKRLSMTNLRHEDLPQDHFYGPYRKPTTDHGDTTLWEQLGPVLSDPYFAPIMAEDFSNLPSTFFYTCQSDILRDEGWLFAKRLKDAGVRVSHFHAVSGLHGACLMPNVKEGKECISSVVEYLENSC